MAKKNVSESKSKNLTLSELKKQNKKDYNEKIKLPLEGYNPILIDKKWRPTKIQELLDEYVQAIRNDLKNAESRLTGTYFVLLMMKYFTSLEIPDGIDNQLAWQDELIDRGLFATIANALPEEERIKLEDHLEELVNNLNNNMDMVHEKVKELEFENDEVEDIALHTPK